MNSTYASEGPILKVENLNIAYKLFRDPQYSLKEKFIQSCKNPLRFFYQDYDLLHLVQDFNLKLYNGDRLGLLGVNGTGKTSICRHIAGMHGQQKSVQVRGSLRVIFDTEVGIIPELSGRDNAHLLAKLIFTELNPNEINLAVQDALEFSELGDFIDIPFKNYSKGMKARLFLSLISAAPSDLLILDEVFDGADLFFGKKIAERVTKMIEASGAVIFVSHSLEQIRKTCNRVLVLNDYKIGYEGEVESGIDYYLEHCNRLDRKTTTTQN